MLSTFDMTVVWSRPPKKNPITSKLKRKSTYAISMARFRTVAVARVRSFPTMASIDVPRALAVARAMASRGSRTSGSRARATTLPRSPTSAVYVPETLTRPFRKG
jgi:hypothetical protein